ncbi:hemerythrin HHE cation binding domain-containing protein [Streptomyces sp. 840.1]|uniref:LLM class flavin-dependent oxidoreductase n=1 Tax=Streptomyces sp. 840.1 TaxID=2485152 RepID=UPI000F485E29|nr:LLM class flavin-dependent oxidoreductase [Streptomyces sp. 840.1]ROQ66575.1 hemerythrin HHE cation binding domain-containing protein [Streptomyces sp. 840.1]
MPDYGHDLLFGAVLVPSADRGEDAVALARIADRSGLDLVSVPDHPYRPELLDAWVVLAVIAASTTRIRVLPNVANLPLRPPAVLARTAAGLDLLSGGRVELGLGAGAYWDAVAADGGPRRTPGEAVRATREAIEIIRALWTPGRPLRFDGKHYGLDGAAPGPAPAHPIGIWLGAIGPRMLGLAGAAADGWVPSVPHVPPGRLAAGHRVIDEAAAGAGREPAAVRRLYNLSPGPGGFPRGAPDTWPEQLAALTLEHGTSAFLLPAQQPRLIEVFAAEVAPATRELVAAERARAAAPAGPRPIPAPAPAPPAPDSGRAGAAGPGDRLSVRPTPDPGVRRSTERLWDESTRPTGPPADPDRRYPRREQEPARNLVAAHDQLRSDLDRLGEVVREVLADTRDPGEARSEIAELTLRQNIWTLGAYCASYCRVTNLHHTREDQDLFPYLRRSDPRLGSVLDRLSEEHHAIQGVIDRVDRELVAFAGAGRDPDGLRAAMDLLTDTLLSHLSYEESELIEPMARFGTGW